ncbi:hypothetical protein PIROE2DRAFT_18156 [Piromyces sp. E2]|nr:hypothetical protein PIROE2DRAFT_18156 [Piromyces sp. E2]|eukprot:OUM57001.1 hypothetical protein PIROE2DRAFT_18156 [Piromyces sp. E2]
MKFRISLVSFLFGISIRNVIASEETPSNINNLDNQSEWTIPSSTHKVIPKETITTTTTFIINRTKTIPTSTTTTKTLPIFAKSISTPNPPNRTAPLVEKLGYYGPLCNDSSSLFLHNNVDVVCLREVITLNDGEYILNSENDNKSQNMPCLVYNNTLYCIDKMVNSNLDCRYHYVIENLLDNCLVFVAKLLNTTIYKFVEKMPEFSNKGRSFVNPNRPFWNPPS